MLRSPQIRATASRWQHRILAIDAGGRINLPPEARAFFDAEPEVRAASRGLVVVLRPGGPGTRVETDRRSRLQLPVWFRDIARGDGTVLVATRAGELVIVAPASILDDFSDQLEALVI